MYFWSPVVIFGRTYGGDTVVLSILTEMEVVA